MKIVIHLSCVLFLSAFLIMGCSSGNSLNLSGFPSKVETENMSQFIGVTDFTSDGLPSGGMGTLGLFSLWLDPQSGQADITPLRQNSLTDVLEVVDITNFLKLAPCSDCVRLKSVSLTPDGFPILTIGIRHPFEAGDILKPPSGKNRADLHVFNVEGIVISNAPATNYSQIGESLADFNLANADGFTAYLDSVIDEFYPTDATIHPYITHFDDYSAGNYSASNPTGFATVTSPPPSGYLVMPMGCDYDYKDYIFNITDPFEFIFAVGCTYAVSAASKSERFIPEYRCPQHNKKASSEVWIEIISNNLEGGNESSQAEIEINVVDINHGVDVGTNLDQMLADSSVSQILIEIPGVETGLINVDTSSPTGFGHDQSDPLAYPATITNTASASSGIYSGLVKVVDSYDPGLNTSPLLEGMDGIKRVDPLLNPLTGLFEISEFATYATFEIEISYTPNIPPVAVLDPVSTVINETETVWFDASESYDTDGTIELYEFDYDWDGVEANFAANASNTTGIIESSPYYSQGVYTAGLRVTDDRDDIAYDSATVTVCGENLTNWRTNLPNSPNQHYYAANLVIDNKIWSIGSANTNAMSVFDMTTESWDTTSRTPVPGGISYYAAAYHDGKIYLIGGLYGGTRINTTIVYNIASNTWDTTTVPPFDGIPRNVAKAVTYNDEIYFCYGLNNDFGGAQEGLDIYTPATNTWRIGTPAPVKRASPFWEVVGNKIYGGYSNNSIAPNSLTFEYYDPATETWTSMGNVDRFRGSVASVVVGEKIYLMGGQQNTTNAWNWVDVYDTIDDSWTQLLDLPEDRGYSPTCGFYGCNIYITVGRGDNYVNLTSTRAGEFF